MNEWAGLQGRAQVIPGGAPFLVSDAAQFVHQVLPVDGGHLGR